MYDPLFGIGTPLVGPHRHHDDQRARLRRNDPANEDVRIGAIAEKSAVTCNVAVCVMTPRPSYSTLTRRGDRASAVGTKQYSQATV